MIQTMILNVFCTTVTSYMNTAVADVTAAMITEYSCTGNYLLTCSDGDLT